MDEATLPIGEIIEEGPWLAGDPVSPPAAAVAEAFRVSMRRLAGGVCAVTVHHGGQLMGLTATSVTSLSMEPPSLLVSIRANSSILPALRQEKRFTVHVLTEEQTRQANVFAGRMGPGPRAGLVSWSHPRGSAQRLSGAACHIDCRVGRVMPVFSHVVVAGVVEQVELGAGDRPLIYFDGAFRSLASAD
ncbi:flavin reductase family protein [Geminicoccus roseus]|uniref:flavin reductase family protein n=1 Tax=Geminicoccus roseus TaxID=404900 RepID=UPI000422859C|nr:flavin reductase family protein [Geminicoccus roseus]